jgi:hypothetical protein
MAICRCGGGILCKDAKSVDEFADYSEDADSAKCACVIACSPDIPFFRFALQKSAQLVCHSRFDIAAMP